MPELQPRTFTRLLLEWRNGDQLAHEELLGLAYEKLYKKAKKFMSLERPGNLLQATALINEVYLRLVRVGQLNWECREDFFAVCSNLMRQILIDLANKNRGKLKVPLDEALLIPQEQPVDLIDIWHWTGQCWRWLNLVPGRVVWSSCATSAG